MFVGCFETSTSAIVKHVQHVGIIRAFLSAWGDLLSLWEPGGTEKIAGLSFTEGDQYPGWHYDFSQEVSFYIF